ncbi:Cap15 family cyclic dinucleotide receptor domain-containing protein [Sphingobium baderi]|uniref:Cap15 family cyclic dinucleotide receptor domain-containing protein n=1 Tax=Sphingobium baderi TaxID=1332080 RepID=UPI002B418481|nr:hypothetical protein [Sphingobium baderi]WRD78389.1 hypothetical protein QQ987_16650 [Sphingobium baderi]
MIQQHEYALLGGFNRATIGRWLGSLAALISGGLVFVVLSAVDLAKSLGLNVNLPPTVLSLVGAGAVYAALYWLFDRRLWKFGPLVKLLRVPDLSGQWECQGNPLQSTVATPWQGRMTIIQTWDKLRLRLETDNSVSNSLSAALLFDEAVGFHLMYHYRNDPKIVAPELKGHHGFAELIFDRDGQSAAGDYFNGRGRNTFGIMKITKVN